MNICFISPNAYSFFDNATDKPFGGSELRALLLGRELAKEDSYKISFVVAGDRLFQAKVHEGIRVYSEYSKLTLKDRILRRISPRYIQPKELDRRNFKNILQKINADYYVCFGAGIHTAKSFGLLQELGKKKVLFIGHDEDLTDEYYSGSTFVNRHGYPGDICYQARTLGDFVICQTNYQLNLAKKRMSQPAFLLRNPIDTTSLESEGKQYDVLWIGRSNKVKRPEIMVDFAKSRPQLNCVMILNKRDQAIHEKILQSAPKNLIIHDFVPRHEIEKYFVKSRIFVSTSLSEGFPNTFLQAGKYGVPVVSLTVNPDGFLDANERGFYCKEDEKILSKHIVTLLADNKVYDAKSRAIKKYVMGNHELGKISKQLDLIINEINQLSK